MCSGHKPDFLEDEARKGRIQQCNINTDIRLKNLVQYGVCHQVQARVVAMDRFGKICIFNKAPGSSHHVNSKPFFFFCFLFLQQEDVILECNLVKNLLHH